MNSLYVPPSTLVSLSSAAAEKRPAKAWNSLIYESIFSFVRPCAISTHIHSTCGIKAHRKVVYLLTQNGMSPAHYIESLRAINPSKGAYVLLAAG